MYQAAEAANKKKGFGIVYLYKIQEKVAQKVNILQYPSQAITNVSWCMVECCNMLSLCYNSTKPTQQRNIKGEKHNPHIWKYGLTFRICLIKNANNAYISFMLVESKYSFK